MLKVDKVEIVDKVNEINYLATFYDLQYRDFIINLKIKFRMSWRKIRFNLLRIKQKMITFQN